MKFLKWTIISTEELTEKMKRITCSAKALADEQIHQYVRLAKNTTKHNEELELKVYELEREIKNISFYHDELNKKYLNLRENK